MSISLTRIVPLAAASIVAAGLAVTAVLRARSEPVTVVCRLCGDHVCRWTSVLWQSEEGSRGNVAVSHSSIVADLCSVCACRVADDVWTAVRAIIVEHRDQVGVS